MDTLKKEQQEAHGRLKVLYEDKERLTVSYKDEKRKVDESKEQLQSMISDYSRLSEKGGVGGDVYKYDDIIPSVMNCPFMAEGLRTFLVIM